MIFILIDYNVFSIVNLLKFLEHVTNWLNMYLCYEYSYIHGVLSEGKGKSLADAILTTGKQSRQSPDMSVMLSNFVQSAITSVF
jgi:hypothetical protein